MTFLGQHLIAGTWTASEGSFASDPVHGPAHSFGIATTAEVEAACNAAEEAFWSYGAASAATRAAFLTAIADEIEARGPALTEIGTQETGLPEARLDGERGRTTGQLRMFAALITGADFPERRHDPVLPDRQPLPRPDLKMVMRPIGPVAVFGASNFPLAFSTGGGDTAAALAAGCPVVVKGHPAHPGTGELVAQAIHAARQSCDLHPGVFSFLQGNDFAAGQALVQHPLIQAVGFTGSLRGGRALFDLCAARPVPIPFFGELGSINPMFLLPGAVAARGAEIGQNWSGSLTMGVGQFCTNPGVAVVVAGPEADALVAAAQSALADVAAQPMLTPGIATAYGARAQSMARAPGVAAALAPGCEGRTARPGLLITSGADFLANRDLGEEVFGPTGLVVQVADPQEMVAVAQSLEGQLTCTLHMTEDDTALAKRLLPILERKAGRLLANGFPTGVEVADAMVHGGPYPASTNFGHSSVGSIAIRRFLRPVCFQNMPEDVFAG